MAITNGYATLPEVRAALRITDSIDDALLEMAIESASRLIDSYANRSFYSAGSAVRYFAADNDYVININDAVSITEIATQSTDDGPWDVIWGADDYQTEPLNGYVDGLGGWPITRVRAIGDYTFPYEDGEALIRITGVWGWSAIPINIRQATIIQASRIFKRLDSPLGVISSDIGMFRVGTRLDPDVAMLIDSYRLTRFYA